MGKVSYTIDWDKVIQVYNDNHLGKISQSTIAKLYNVSDVTISNNKYTPVTQKVIDKYKPLYEKHFEKLIPMGKVLKKYEKDLVY